MRFGRCPLLAVSGHSLPRILDLIKALGLATGMNMGCLYGGPLFIFANEARLGSAKQVRTEPHASRATM